MQTNCSSEKYPGDHLITTGMFSTEMLWRQWNTAVMGLWGTLTGLCKGMWRKLSLGISCPVPISAGAVEGNCSALLPGLLAAVLQDPSSSSSAPQGRELQPQPDPAMPRDFSSGEDEEGWGLGMLSALPWQQQSTREGWWSPAGGGEIQKELLDPH